MLLSSSKTLRATSSALCGTDLAAAPRSDVTPSDEQSPAQWVADEGLRPNFHQRDAAAIADEAGLGEHGRVQVERVQDFFRRVSELVEDGAWPDAPVGPLGDQWRGVGGAQSTYYLINVRNVLYTLMGNASPGVGRTITQRLKTMLRPSDEHAYEEALVELEIGDMRWHRRPNSPTSSATPRTQTQRCPYPRRWIAR